MTWLESLAVGVCVFAFGFHAGLLYATLRK